MSLSSQCLLLVLQCTKIKEKEASKFSKGKHVKKNVSLKFFEFHFFLLLRRIILLFA